MTGFAYPEMMVGVWRSYAARDMERARDLFDAYLPLARYEQQPGLGLAIRKYILSKTRSDRIGHIEEAGEPIVGLDIAEIEFLIGRQIQTPARHVLEVWSR